MRCAVCGEAIRPTFGRRRWVHAHSDDEYCHTGDGAMATPATKVGDRVKAVHFGPSKVIDDNITVPPGTQGTVHHIDDAGTVFVRWDNGSTIGLLPGTDQWKDLS